MAVNSTTGSSAIAELETLKRTFNAFGDWVYNGLLVDMDRLVELVDYFRHKATKLQNEKLSLHSKLAELEESNRKLTNRVHEFTQREFDSKNQKKKIEKEFAAYVKRVNVALGIIDHDRLRVLPPREQECIRELSNVTQNFTSVGSVRRRSTNIADIDESQEASWLFNEGDRDASRDALADTSTVNAGPNMSRTRSGRPYSRCQADMQPISFPSDEIQVQLPPKPPRSPNRRRSRSTDNKIATEIPTKPYSALGRRSRSETRVIEPLASLTRSPSSSLARPHIFVQATVLKTHSCLVCQKKARFGQVMMQCTDCSSIVHPDCRNSAPLPCWGKRWNSPASAGTPRVRWGNASPQHTGLSLTGLVNELPPFVPAVVIQCVQEVESRGMNEPGLYRISGSLAEIRELRKQLYQGKYPPNFAQVRDINVITGILKDFLNSLSEPIIPSAIRHDFVNAMDLDRNQKIERLKDLVKNFPDAHHDTLVYLILHLQRVASTPATNMPVKNLARVLAPTIFGSCPTGTTSVAITHDAEKIAEALETLLDIDNSYWRQHLRLDSKSMYPKTPTQTSRHPMPANNADGEISSINGDDATRYTANSTNSAVGHTVRSFFSRPDSSQQAKMFTSTNPSKKSSRKENR